MVSSVEGAASNTPVRDGGRKKSSSRGPPLFYAKKSKAREESRTSETRAVSPGEVAHGDGSGRSRAVTLEVMERDSGDSTSSEASSRVGRAIAAPAALVQLAQNLAQKAAALVKMMTAAQRRKTATANLTVRSWRRRRTRCQFA
jgi:hypothetical protein